MIAMFKMAGFVKTIHIPYERPEYVFARPQDISFSNKPIDSSEQLSIKEWVFYHKKTYEVEGEQVAVYEYGGER